MNLVEKLKKSARVGGLVAALFLPGCAFQEGREKVTFVAIPFFPTYVRHQTFKTEECKKIEEETEISMSSFFGTAWIEIKKYGEDREYLGKQKITIKNDWGTYKIFTKSYDSDNKIIETEEGFPENLPEGVDINISR